MAEGSEPKDVADMLEALARKIRNEPELPAGTPAQRDALTVSPTLDALSTAPTLGAIDMFTDRDAVTVTLETRNTEARQVQVSVLNGHLLIDVGEGAQALHRDLTLPALVDEEAAVATFRNGVLDVVLPIRRR